MRVLPIPLFADNYCYAVIGRGASSFALVDAAHYPSILAYIQNSDILRKLRLTHVLTTHKHEDHSGGNRDLSAAHPNVSILGGREDEVPACTRTVSDNDEVEWEGVRGRVLAVPCHTRGHVAYYLRDEESQVVFTGDTLFVGGCGRFFEGSAQEMHTAFQRVLTLPGDTLMYPGHEYTVANLRWAAQVDKTNPHLQAKLSWAEEARRQGLFTVPSTLQEELTYNVFLRAAHFQALTGTSDPVSCLAELRRWKNENRVERS
jgi:hydroxyacylglutathione hydrolase